MSILILVLLVVVALGATLVFAQHTAGFVFGALGLLKVLDFVLYSTKPENRKPLQISIVAVLTVLLVSLYLSTSYYMSAIFGEPSISSQWQTIGAFIKSGLWGHTVGGSVFAAYALYKLVKVRLDSWDFEYDTVAREEAWTRICAFFVFIFLSAFSLRTYLLIQ
jgi:hypothetical protein